MATLLFHNRWLAVVSALVFAGITCAPTQYVADAKKGYEIRGETLGRLKGDDVSTGIGLTLSQADLETVWADATAASREIEAGRGMGAEWIFLGKESRLFAINQDLAGGGLIAERSRNILGAAMRRRLSRLESIGDCEYVIVGRWDLEATTAAMYKDPKLVRRCLESFKSLPITLFRYGASNEIANPLLRVRIKTKAGLHYQFGLAYEGSWPMIRNSVAEPLRKVIDAAQEAAAKRNAERKEWMRKNPGKPMPRRFWTPPKDNPIIVE